MSRLSRKIRSFGALLEQRVAWKLIDGSHMVLEGAELIPRHGGALVQLDRRLSVPEAVRLTALLSVCTGRRPCLSIGGRFASLPVVRAALERLGTAVTTLDDVSRLLERGEVVCLYPEGPLGDAVAVARRTGVSVIPLVPSARESATGEARFELRDPGARVGEV